MLNAVFYEAQARAGRGAVALRRDQEAWLGRRDACAGNAGQGPAAVADCIGRAYDERIAELEVVRTQPQLAAPVSPSFNCRYARTPVEQAICRDSALAAKDRRMARLYERAGGSRFGPVEPTQSAWLATRDACARVAGPALHACIHEAYDARIAGLDPVILAGRAVARGIHVTTPWASFPSPTGRIGWHAPFCFTSRGPGSQPLGGRPAVKSLARHAAAAPLKQKRPCWALPSVAVFFAYAADLRIAESFSGLTTTNLGFR
jgi:uncharacterized protein